MLFESNAGAMIQSMFRQEDKAQLAALLSYARSWWDADPAEYEKQIARRLSYLDGEMEVDLDELLLQEFPKTYKLMKEKKVMLPIMKFITEKKCVAFDGIGQEIYLVDAKGERHDPLSKESKALAHLVKEGDFLTTAKRAQRIREATHSVAVRAWYDDRVNSIQFSAYDSLGALLVVNPERSHDALASVAALLRRDGYDGIGSDPVWEYWGTRAADVAAETDSDGMLSFDPTIHFLTSAKAGPRKVNEGDLNPFKDQYADGRPMFPFSWWVDRKHTIYRRGGDSLVKFNRLLNLGLTWLHNNMEWQMSAIPVIEAGAGVDLVALDKFKGSYIAHPKFMMELPPGCSLSFEAPDNDLGKFANIYEMLIQYHGLMNNLAPKSVSIEGGLPQSGAALRIEMDNLVKENDSQVQTLRPQVEEALRVGIVEQNYYAGKIGVAVIGPNLFPAWSPGAMQAAPKDRNDINAHYSVAIPQGAATADEWVAELHDIPRAEAAKRVDENMARTAEIMQAMTAYPAEPSPAKTAEKEIDALIKPDDTKPEGVEDEPIEE